MIIYKTQTQHTYDLYSVYIIHTHYFTHTDMRRTHIQLHNYLHIYILYRGEIHERRIENDNSNASERGQMGAELRRSPDYLMPELFLDKIHCMCIFYSVFMHITTRVNKLCYIDI